MQQSLLPISDLIARKKWAQAILSIFEVSAIFGFFLFVPFLFSCSQNSPPTVSILHRNVVVDFIDPSGTAIGAGWPNPPTSFYLDQINWLKDNGGGVLDIINISNSIPQELTIEVKALVKVPNAVDVGEEETRKIMAENTSAEASNSKAQSRFISQLDSFIVKYNPKNALSGDLSFINANLNSLIKKIEEPAFASYKHHAFIYSDLQDEPGKGIKRSADSALIEELNSCGCDIAICFLRDKNLENAAVKKLIATQLSSYNDFIYHLNSSPKKTKQYEKL